MVDDQGYIQPCTCQTSPDMPGYGTFEISSFGCRILHGTLRFYRDSNLPEWLKEQLSTIEELYGAIEIINTTFTSLDFLKNLRKIIFPKSYGNGTIVQIVGNANLTTLGFAVDHVQYEEKMASREQPAVVIRKNFKLKWHPTQWQYYKDYVLSEFDHTSLETPAVAMLSPCPLIEPISKNIDSIKECLYVKGNLTIDSSFDHYSMEEMDEIFGYLQDLDGCLTIRGTKLTNLTFFHDLHRVECLAERAAVIIEDNPELEVLDVQIHEFDNSSSPVTVKISNNPKLCLREVDYLKTLMELDAPWRSIDFDRWNEKCRDSRDYSHMLIYYHIVVAGILAAGMIILEIVVRLIRRRRKVDKVE